MFKGVALSSSLGGTSGAPSDDDDDNISLTSTIPDEHDPETKFVVDDVLAEMPLSGEMSGETRYLIQWEGFGLHDCTWEPEENLGRELKAMWEKKKEGFAKGEGTPFNIELFYEAQRKASDEKAERHRRRNAKRRRKGLPLTPPFEEVSSEEELEAFYEESARKLVTKETPSKTATASAKGTTRKADQSDKHPEARRQSSGKSVTGEKDLSGNKAPAASANPSSSRKLSDRPSSTGYQGTARKLSGTSAGIDEVAGKVKTSAPSQGASSFSAGKTGSTIQNSTLKARKTVQKKVSTTATNIFAGGKTRAPRTTLQQAMSDPSRGKKMFPTLRARRLAEKRGRDMEDLPPALETIIPLNGKIPNRATSNEAFSPSPIARTPSVELKSAIAPREDAPTKKKRKSVRWVEEEGADKAIVEEPEQMDIDSPDTTMSSNATPQARHPRLKSPPPPTEKDNNSLERLSLDLYYTNVSLRSLEKIVRVGNSADLITVTFDGVPRDPAQDWISSFVAQDRIEFRHTCFSKTIKTRLGEFVKSQSADGTSHLTINGTITSTRAESTLEIVAQYLRAGLLGLYYTDSHWSVVVYPTRCEEWKDVWAGQEPTSPSGAALRYAAFSTTMDYRPFLRPTSAAPRPFEKLEEVSARQLLMSRLHKVDYDKLLPKYSKLPPAHGFFLAFPQSREASMLSLYHWLRDCNPHCHFYSSHQPGAWAAFWAGISDGRFRGAVVVHETLVPSLFRFPMLSKHLIRGFEEYWCFSEATQAQPVSQSIFATAGSVSPGKMRFSRLFPARTVICVTPTFLVSEPQRAYEFFEWFLDNSKKGHYYRLVTAWNIHEYLMDLAIEKFKDWEDLRSRPIPSVELAMEVNLRRLGAENCDYRFRTAALAQELQSQRIVNTALYGAEDFEDDSSPLIYADPSIDPNDEQSLVNWFGYWTTLRFDQFKKFHVLGSSPDMTISQRKRGERRIRLPSYTRGTLNDPDAVLKAQWKKEMELDQSAESIGGEPHGQASNEMVAPGRKGRNPFTFPSALISNEREIHRMLESLLTSHRFPPRYSLWVLNIFPVSWVDLQMSDHFGDFEHTYSRFSDWFRYAYRFADPRLPQFKTYIGFFYTITEDWDPQTTPRPSAHYTPQRHPWLLFYRPVNPHQNQYKRCEILIWDPSAKERVPGSREPTEKDLLDMQRRAIQFIRENTNDKNPGSWIDEVWLGGFEPPTDHESPYPFDRTMAFLENALKNLKDEIPAPQKALSNKGFRKVVMQKDDVHSPSGSMAMDIDDNSQAEEGDKEDNEDLRIIFHPPRATRLPPGQRTQCTNRLYEEVRLARAHAAHGDRDTDIRYSFAPTEEWYAQQRKEGRSFEHINVQSWENIFNLFKIGTSKAVVEGPAADEGSADSPASL